MVKTVHIHVGPHKTGSTSIQKCLHDHQGAIRRAFGIHVIDHRLASQFAHVLNDGDEVAIKTHLELIKEQCDATEVDCIFSSEDLSGDLPGRTARRRPYARLWQNLKVLVKGLTPYRCVFYFFVRDPDCWVKSAYVQNLRFRNRFSDQVEFRNFYHFDGLWEGVLGRSIEMLGENLVLIPYLENESFSAVTALLERVSPNYHVGILGHENIRVNTMPKEEEIATMESINRSSASSEAKRKAKISALDTSRPPLTDPEGMYFLDWTKRAERPEWLSDDLSLLWSRTGQRTYIQDQPNLLPDPFVDLTRYRTRLVSAPAEFPEGGRSEMTNQAKILAFRFRGFPETCVLLGLTISYLRRQTEHTEHAAFLFQRLWEEEYNILLGTLQTRWLISVFQTFLDHGANEEQRLIGGSGYFYSNMLKAYEAERALEGLPADSCYPNKQAVTDTGFEGLDRFNLGGTDLIVNMNALLLEVAAREKRAGRVVQEFLLRLKNAQTLMSRMDNSRKKYEIDIPQFANCWSFFDEPTQS